MTGVAFMRHTRMPCERYQNPNFASSLHSEICWCDSGTEDSEEDGISIMFKKKPNVSPSTQLHARKPQGIQEEPHHSLTHPHRSNPSPPSAPQTAAAPLTKSSPTSPSPSPFPAPPPPPPKTTPPTNNVPPPRELPYEMTSYLKPRAQHASPPRKAWS